MPPNIPPELLQQLLQQMMAQGEYSTSKGWSPMHQVTQAQALNLQQDMMTTLFDPRFAMMIGEGAYDPNAMALAMQQYDAGSNEGQTFLQNVLTKSPDSPRALIAKALMKGYDPTTAVAEARAAWEANGMDWPKVTDKDGMEVDDPSITQFAQDGWTQLMSDRAATGTNDPFTAAGFTDPTARFTPQMFSDLVDAETGRTKMDVLNEQAKATRLAMHQANTKEQDYFKSFDPTGVHDMIDMVRGLDLPTVAPRSIGEIGGALTPQRKDVAGSGRNLTADPSKGKSSADRVADGDNPMIPSWKEGPSRAEQAAGAVADPRIKAEFIAQAVGAADPKAAGLLPSIIAQPSKAQGMADVAGASPFDIPWLRPQPQVPAGPNAPGYGTRPSTFAALGAMDPKERAVRDALGGISGIFGAKPKAASNPNIDAGKARIKATTTASDSALEAMKARAQAQAVTSMYGSPYMMQMAQRQAALRQLGVLP